MKGHVERPDRAGDEEENLTTESERNTVFYLGVFSLLQVPVFKTVTHMPPFMGVLLGLGFMWVVTEILHRKKSMHARSKLAVIHVLRKIDTPSVLFFLGILIAVASLQSAGQLTALAQYLDSSIGTDESSGIYIVNVIIGLLSSIVDNVPLVAAAMGMYPLADAGFFAQDGLFWEFLAYCAGTGGSCLIIGSAAGVAVMGIMKIDFVWYLKKMSLLALSGYLAGAVVYYVMFEWIIG
jgi:Na+/H+ antiporter NhaD/arsenite permease-like protein